MRRGMWHQDPKALNLKRAPAFAAAAYAALAVGKRQRSVKQQGGSAPKLEESGH